MHGVLLQAAPTSGDLFVALAAGIVTFLRDAGLLGMFVGLGILLWRKGLVLGWTYQETVEANKELRVENRELQAALRDAATSSARATHVADVAVREGVRRGREQRASGD